MLGLWVGCGLWEETNAPKPQGFKVQSSKDFQLLPAGDLPNAAPTKSPSFFQPNASHSNVFTCLHCSELHYSRRYVPSDCPCLLCWRNMPLIARSMARTFGRIRTACLE